MFEKRLKWFTLLLAGVTLVVLLRLVQIQVVRAEHYQALADGMLTQPTRYYRAARGSILDRRGRVLVSDIPAFDVAMHYAVLSGHSERYLRALAGQRHRRGLTPPGQTLEDTLIELRGGVAETWERLAALTGRPLEELLDVGELVRRRVERIRERRERVLGVVEPVREEQSFHTVVGGVDDGLALRARMELEQYPWVAIQPGTRRVAHDADHLVHVLGRLGAASRERLEEDPLAYDELRRLVPGDLCGISGVERAAELNLRGTRGRVSFRFDGSVAERIEPRRGRDVLLTIDAALQRSVLDILQRAVDASEFPAGGSAVVIDVLRREVLALVSYPVYAHDSHSQEYERLRRDTRWLPLRFRAVADQYPPGSTCKAIALVAALSDGLASPQERIHCRGFLLPNQPNIFRCWIYNQHGTTHDDSHNPAGQSAEDAVRNSCNIYFFTIGQRLGAARICDWFEQFGLGRLQGTGLIEESPGIVPTESWLRDAQGRGHQTADAWNYAIGQGEVTTTPLQAANIAATIAAGRWEPVRLIRDEQGDPLRVAVEPARSFDESACRVLRAGMWRVVNEDGGTARAARLALRGFELCGKTGSAQATPRVLRSAYTVEWPDGRRRTVTAESEEDALATAADQPVDGAWAEARPRVVARRTVERYPPWQPGQPLPSHAWFIGYTQPAGTPRGAAPQEDVYAVAVIIEYGGSGGRVAGPVARDIAQAVLGGSHQSGLFMSVEP